MSRVQNSGFGTLPMQLGYKSGYPQQADAFPRQTSSYGGYDPAFSWGNQAALPQRFVSDPSHNVSMTTNTARAASRSMYSDWVTVVKFVIKETDMFWTRVLLPMMEALQQLMAARRGLVDNGVKLISCVDHLRRCGH